MRPGQRHLLFPKPVWEKSCSTSSRRTPPARCGRAAQKPEFPDENGFTVALSYEGKVVYFDWFHFLADGRGMAPFMTMVLQFYCNLRYGTAFEGRTLETDPAYDIEDILQSTLRVRWPTICTPRGADL